MKALASILIAAASLLLSGCATTLRSNVTVFHQWPADLSEKTYVFETPPPAEDTLEHRNYLGLVSNELAKLAGNPPSPYTRDGKTEPRYDATVWKRKSGPFWELIAFSDAEGVIGPVVCKRVHADFVRFAAAAARHPDPGFRASYEDWKTAFAMCAQGGAIVFH